MCFKTKRSWMLMGILLFTAVLSSVSSAEDKMEEDKPAAIVNGSVITKSYLDQNLNMILKQYPQNAPVFDQNRLAGIRMKVLDDIINRDLLFQESKKSGVKIDPELLDKEITRIKSRHADEASFKEFLSTMDLKESEMRKQVGKGIAIKAYVDTKIKNTVEVSEEELKSYYYENQKRFTQPETVRASHILIKVPSDADESFKEKAKKEIGMIRSRVVKGEDFAELAKKFSQGPSAGKGGELGYFQRGQMVKPFEDSAFALKPGEISDIVETRFGYHIIKVFHKKPAETKAFQDVRVRLEEFLKQSRVREKIMERVENLREEAKIEKFISATVPDKKAE